MNPSPKKLQKAVEAWLRAEHEFRLGKNAFDRQSARHYIQAEDELREALTGRSDLRAARIQLKRKERGRI